MSEQVCYESTFQLADFHITSTPAAPGPAVGILPVWAVAMVEKVNMTGASIADTTGASPSAVRLNHADGLTSGREVMNAVVPPVRITIHDTTGQKLL